MCSGYIFKYISPLLVLYEIFRLDHKSVTLMLPVNTSVQEVMSSVVNPGGDHVLVKMNSVGGKALLSLTWVIYEMLYTFKDIYWNVLIMKQRDLRVSFTERVVWILHVSDRAQLKQDATAVYTSLGFNERLFLCTASQVELLVRLPQPPLSLELASCLQAIKQPHHVV